MNDVVLDRNYKKVFYYWGFFTGIITPVLWLVQFVPVFMWVSVVFWVAFIILSNQHMGEPIIMKDGYRVLNKKHEKFVYAWGTSVGLIYFIGLPFYILLVFV